MYIFLCLQGKIIIRTVELSENKICVWISEDEIDEYNVTQIYNFYFNCLCSVQQWDNY